MTDLETKLNIILNEKTDKIIPENIKKDVKIFDITGTLETGTQINNQDKTITSNGTYQADANYTGLGTVTVNVPQSGGDIPVKLFETVEQMQADTTAKEKDLALVYRNEVQNAKVDSQFKTATFPQTVVLDTAITDYVELQYRAVDGSTFDCWGSLDANMFRMDCYSDAGEIRISYESFDGITYTRVDDTGNPVDFGVEIQYAYPEMWNDAIGKFIQVGGATFEGLFEYAINVLDKSILKFPLLSGITINGTDRTFNGDCIEFTRLSELNQLLIKIKNEENYSDFSTALYIKNDQLHVIGYPNPNNGVTWVRLKYDFATPKYYACQESYSDANPLVDYTLNLDNQSYTKTTINAFNTENKGPWYLAYDVDSDTSFLTYFSYKSFPDCFGSDVINCMNSSTPNTSYWYSSYPVVNYPDDNPFKIVNKYVLAPNQLTATSDEVYKKVFYGSNGIETGTFSNEIDPNCNDTTAKIYSEIMQKYAEIEPIQLTNSNYQQFHGMYFIPTKLDGTPLWDTSALTTMQEMFRYENNLVTVPKLNTSNVTTMYGVFDNCDNLKSVAELDTSKVTNMQSMFNGCPSLVSIPKLDTTNVLDLGGFCYCCSALVNVPEMNIPAATSLNIAFEGCPNLSDESLNNILKMCISATAYIAQGTNLTLKTLGLTSTQATKCATLSNYQAFIDAGWTTGY